MSHLLPAVVYKRLLDRDAKSPHPLMFSKASERQTSRQVQQHLLCSCCEQRFPREGEDWTLR